MVECNSIISVAWRKLRLNKRGLNFAQMLIAHMLNLYLFHNMNYYIIYETQLADLLVDSLFPTVVELRTFDPKLIENHVIVFKHLQTLPHFFNFFTFVATNPKICQKAVFSKGLGPEGPLAARLAALQPAAHRSSRSPRHGGQLQRAETELVGSSR